MENKTCSAHLSDNTIQHKTVYPKNKNKNCTNEITVIKEIKIIIIKHRKPTLNTFYHPWATKTMPNTLQYSIFSLDKTCNLG